MVDLYGFAAGKTIELPIAGNPVSFTVAGVWRDYARPQGAVAIERDRYVALTGDRSATGVALWLAPGASPEALQRAIGEIAGDDKLEIASSGEIRELSLQAFDRSGPKSWRTSAPTLISIWRRFRAKKRRRCSPPQRRSRNPAPNRRMFRRLRFRSNPWQQSLRAQLQNNRCSVRTRNRSGFRSSEACADDPSEGCARQSRARAAR
jgi:hypothetical protein